MVLKRVLKILIFLIVLFTCSTSFAECLPHTASTFYCVKYIYAHDGDTLTVDIPNTHPLLGKRISVRIRNIDTPELNSRAKCLKAKAVAAKTYAKVALSSAKEINLVNVSRDKYFRIVATVMVDNKDLGMLLISKKLAIWYSGGTKPVWKCK